MGQRTSFAACLQPLDIIAPLEDTPSATMFRTCALIAATPHTPVNRKLVTDRCQSHIIPRPRSCLAAARGACPQPLASCSDRCATATQALSRAASPLASRQPGQPAQGGRASTAQSAPVGGSRRGHSLAGSLTAAVPPVLQFEGWWTLSGHSGSRLKCSIHITYHTDTDPAAFFVRGALDSSSTAGSRSTGQHCRCAACDAQQQSSSGCHGAHGSAHRSSSSHGRHCSAAGDGGRDSSAGPAVLRPQGTWLCVAGALGEPLDHWDLHVGAELTLLSRKVVLKRASCATMAWLDAWAKLLLQQQYSLEQQLAKFAVVIPGDGLVRHSPQRSDWSLSPGTPLNPTGGQVNLRHLCESVAVLAACLRQHKAAVHLPRQLSDLTPQGPLNWSLEEEPQVVCTQPFTPAPKHSSSSQLLQREFARCGQPGVLRRLPSLGSTPAGERAPNNAGSLISWLQSIPLAASAARDPLRPAAPCMQLQAGGLLELPQTPAAWQRKR